MSAATQIYYASFDASFLKLPTPPRARVEAAVDDIGSRLASYPHHRLKGSNRFRTRVGDYPIIYAPARDRASTRNLSSHLIARCDAVGSALLNCQFLSARCTAGLCAENRGNCERTAAAAFRKLRRYISDWKSLCGRRPAALLRLRLFGRANSNLERSRDDKVNRRRFSRCQERSSPSGACRRPSSYESSILIS